MRFGQYFFLYAHTKKVFHMASAAARGEPNGAWGRSAAGASHPVRHWHRAAASQKGLLVMYLTPQTSNVSSNKNRNFSTPEVKKNSNRESYEKRKIRKNM